MVMLTCIRGWVSKIRSISRADILYPPDYHATDIIINNNKVLEQIRSNTSRPLDLN